LRVTEERRERRPRTSLLTSLFSLLFLLGGTSCVDTPKLAWKHYRKGASTKLPKADGEATQKARAQEVSLQQEGGKWVVSSGVLDFYQSNTPRETLNTFILAIEKERLEVLYGLLPKRDKEKITEEEFTTNLTKNLDELKHTAEKLKKHLDDPIRIIGDTAALFYQSGSAELVFEQDHWCILAVQ
jgi:hypothetical protein